MMTVPEITQEAQQQAEASVAGPAAEILERLAEKLGSKASVSAVFGEPVARAGITIIPVARVGFGFGGGLGRGGRPSEIAQGGGGGGGASAAPAGYIEIKDGNAVFKPIRDPLVDVVIPLATLIAGIAGRRRGRVRPLLVHGPPGHPRHARRRANLRSVDAASRNGRGHLEDPDRRHGDRQHVPPSGGAGEGRGDR